MSASTATLRDSSMWLLTPAAELLFKTAKERIYRLERSKPTKRVPDPVARLVPVLEENPKWRLLRQVLTEIRCEWNRRRRRTTDHHNADATIAGGARVLVMVKDERTLDAVRSYLVDGKERVMTLRWLNYLKQINDRSRAIAKSSGGDTCHNISEESRLLLEEEGRARNYLFGSTSNKKTHHRRTRGMPSSLEEKNIYKKKNQTQRELKKRDAGAVGVDKSTLNAIPNWKRKRRKVNQEWNRGQLTMQSKDDQERRAVLDEALEETEQYQSKIASDPHPDDGDEDVSSSSSSQSSSPNDDSSDEEDEKIFKVEELDDMRVVIQTYTSTEGEQAYLLLNDTKPDFVVLYDAETSFIRSLEIYAACARQHVSPNDGQSCASARLQVYFMLFEASSEEKNFFKSLEREKNAFERLIQHKKSMPLPVNTMGACTTQEMQQAFGGAGGSCYAGGTLPLSMDTRTGRGKQKEKDKRDIAVDVREFRSALPSVLHQGGMRLAPVTLTVGDFVLSNVHCVERKSISDLFGSFASGRLFTQAESMSKHYKVPCLLIEFDPAKSFSLQNCNEIGADLRTDNICSKMSLLVMHFPKLRILWSRNQHETLKLFKALKSNHEEVDVEKAVEVGRNESIDSLLKDTGDDEENEINEAARDMLLRLPGITLHHARKIMNVCDSIADLADMPRDQLKFLLGPVTGQRLFSFFRQKLAAT